MSDDDLTCSGCGEYVGSHIADRIRELEAERDTAWRYLDLLGYNARPHSERTHVIVPVEPTEAMLKAGWRAKDRVFDLAPDIGGIYRAMIRAAQKEQADE